MLPFTFQLRNAQVRYNEVLLHMAMLSSGVICELWIANEFLRMQSWCLPGRYNEIHKKQNNMPEGRDLNPRPRELKCCVGHT
jgi:hypothetical protein